MAVQLPYTFLMTGDRYDLTGMAGRDALKPDQLPAPRRKLPKIRHATYEIVTDALYPVGLSPEEGNVHYLNSGRRRYEKMSPTASPGLGMVLPFMGKIRLARNFLDEPFINLVYKKAMGFEIVIDVIRAPAVLSQDIPFFKEDVMRNPTGFKRVPALDKCLAVIDLLAQSQQSTGISEIPYQPGHNKSKVSTYVTPLLTDLNALKIHHSR